MSADQFFIPAPETVASSVMSVGRTFAERARWRPGALAVEDGRRALTYGALDNRVNRLGNALLQSGVGHGDRIALLSHNAIEYLEVMLAAAKTGAVVCCLNWRLAPAELTHCIDLVSPSVIIHQPDLSWATGNTASKTHQTIELGDEYEATLAAASDADPDQEVGGEDGLIILYTSGTTGLPKGALISHRATLFRSLVYANEFRVPANDTFFAWSPLFHMGAADHSLATLLQGGKVFVTDGFDLDLILPALECNRTQWFSLLPGVADRLIDVVKATKPKFRGLGTVGGMADLMQPDRIREITDLFQAPYLNTFGSTETGLAPASGSLIPIGVTPTTLSKQQTGYCEVRLVDDDDVDVPIGTPGEVALRGPTLFSGYVRNEEANSQSFRNGWFHMGDVMCRNPDGTLDFVDRKKYLIKSGGENIYPAEIELAIMSDQRVAEVAVIAKRDVKWGEVPVAIVSRRDASLSAEEVVDICLQKLARYKRPKEVHFIAADQFPRTSTGKVQRRLLEEQFA